MKVNYLTTNELKFKIAKNYFDTTDDIELIQHAFDVPEIQSDSCGEVACYSAVYAAKELGEPCVKLDAGFFIDTLGGFPGPFVKYVNEWLDEEKYLALLEGTTNRAAYFLDATAVGFPDGTSRVFTKKYGGTIVENGHYIPSAWPANSLFIPDGYDEPLGAMPDLVQEKYWGDGLWAEVVEYLRAYEA